MPATHHRTVMVRGLEVFYRESGPPDAPVLLLLHGYPTSSHMFRHLIPALADTYRVIAPDHIGFGRSSATTVDEFEYTFDALADVTRAFLSELGVAEYTVYVQDYGAPIAWRLALADPAAVEGAISQNGNAYEDGFVPEFWEPIWAYGADPSEQNEQNLRPDSGTPVLAVWGRNDEIFDAAGAKAFLRDAPAARVELIDAGHFLLESHLDDVARLIRDWRGGF
ncbi:alpha/beta fold hydrolase [Agromyces humatus]|uniref:AB hydrolase-1 domain-containing protein n=1 Tax=Agromyces humatus TaxID=279573 RepID=A0ABN2KMM5_9MICO|nr:alpha/beta fold hydrolase [Agromyces humatus]